MAISPFTTSTVAVAVLQFVVSSSQISYVMLYDPLGAFAERLTSPDASTLRKPSVFGVTSVFKAVTAVPFKVSLVFTFPTVVAVAPDVLVPNGSLLATKAFTTSTEAVAVLQLVVLISQI